MAHATWPMSHGPCVSLPLLTLPRTSLSYIPHAPPHIPNSRCLLRLTLTSSKVITAGHHTPSQSHNKRDSLFHDSPISICAHAPQAHDACNIPVDTAFPPPRPNPFPWLPGPWDERWLLRG
jgi:hypothetical protein